MKKNKKIKLIIAGGREFRNYNLLSEVMEKYTRAYGLTSKDMVVISGCCRGADKMGELWAKARGYEVKYFPAYWHKYGYKSAGPVRNRKMAEFADRMVLFWDGQSPGSANMLKLAQMYDLLIKVVRI